ncbi:WD40 repeat domain-containing protein [Nonomuraea sp. SMC257]|uniref:WD40 repeat domain-containing protein n=1 Tax=Nonomuraea montanisoli TaxID=2741721 RepID=A0A7Y6I4B9_9ACTN|nr:WD40 repeat domain-containing protein [Nonomuraea montanisoli]NUW31462.1 WD40 repeat domain-containing protein [Nonomuraea montanisoli]
MPLDLTSLNEAGPALLRDALDGSWPPALARACRRALPRLLALPPGPGRLEFLRATAAAEEPEALAALDAAAAAEEPEAPAAPEAAGQGTWTLAWEAGEGPTAFHVCPARHDGPVRAVAVGEFAGRTFVASGGDDQVVRLRDALDQSGPDLEGMTAGVRALAFGVVDGRPVLAGGDQAGTVRTWDPLTAAPGFTREATGGHPTALAFVAAGEGRTLLAVAIGFPGRGYPGDGEDGRVDLLDPSTGELVRELRTEDGDALLDLAVAGLDGRTALAALSPYEVYVWDVATGERLGSAYVGDVCDEDMDREGFTPPLLLSLSGGRPEVGVVVVVERPPSYTTTSREILYLELENLAASSPGQLLDRDQGPVAVTTHAGRDVMLVANHTSDSGRTWERPARAVIRRWGGEPDVALDADTSLVTAAAFGGLAGDLCLATAGLDGTVQVWDARTPHRHRRVGYGGSGLALFTTEQGAPVLAAGTHSDTVLLLDAASGERIGSVGCRRSGRGHDCDLSPYEHCCRGLAAGDVARRPYVASSGCASHGTMLWRPLSETPGVAPKDDPGGGRVTFTDGGYSPAALAFGEADGRALLAAGAEVWDPLTHERVAQLHRSGFLISENAFGRAGDLPVLATRRDDEVDLWDPLTGRRVRTLGVDDAGAGLAMGRVAGRDVLAVGSGRYVVLWDAATGERWEWVPHTSAVTCLSLVEHGDRALLVTGTEDGTVALWDAATQRRLAVLGAFARPVRSVAAAGIGCGLHVYGQSLYGRVLAWRVEVP